MPNFDNMHAIDSVIGGVTIPRFLRVRQHFSSREVTDVGAEIRHSMEERQLYGTIKPGSRVVIAVGSRQIANLAVMVKELVDIVKERQAHPFIMPAMGSHGGATAEGQAEILDTFGVNEAAMGAPILSAMEVSHIGDSENGDPVWVASHLLQADAVIIVNRVKPHPAFSGPIESGITKMSVIGLGKQKGAEYCPPEGTGRLQQQITGHEPRGFPEASHHFRCRHSGEPLRQNRRDPLHPRGSGGGGGAEASGARTAVYAPDPSGQAGRAHR